MEQANGGFYLRELSRLSFFAMENLFLDFSFSPFILFIYLFSGKRCVWRPRKWNETAHPPSTTTELIPL